MESLEYENIHRARRQISLPKGLSQLSLVGSCPLWLALILMLLKRLNHCVHIDEVPIGSLGLIRPHVLVL